MFSFLHKNYPIVRLKKDGKFKRAIMFDDGISYLVAEKIHNIALANKLIPTLKKVFDCDDIIARIIVYSFLNIDQNTYKRK